MLVEVKLFAMAKQRIGSDRMQVELQPEATVGDLRRALVRQYPSLADSERHFRFAINSDYANDETVIPPGAEIACIPPVSGG
jgi:molybdopterin converting factor subunit 1